MSKYEHLLDEARENGIEVIERYPFSSSRIRGLCCENTIALSAQIDTEAERTVVLGEELIHATHSAGNILNDARMERRARERNYDRLVGLAGLVKAYLAGCREPWELAEHLCVPQDFLLEVMHNYRERYGLYATVQTSEGVFALGFEPTFYLKKLKPKRKPFADKEATV